MFRLLIVSAVLTGAAMAGDCISKNGVKCLKKSELPSGFGPMMLGGDPCFVNSGNRVGRIMDKLQLTGQTLGRVLNSRSGCVSAMQLRCFETKLPN
jgi:hypothetical protein